MTIQLVRSLTLSFQQRMAQGRESSPAPAEDRGVSLPNWRLQEEGDEDVIFGPAAGLQMAAPAHALHDVAHDEAAEGKKKEEVAHPPAGLHRRVRRPSIVPDVASLAQAIRSDRLREEWKRTYSKSLSARRWLLGFLTLYLTVVALLPPILSKSGVSIDTNDTVQLVVFGVAVLLTLWGFTYTYENDRTDEAVGDFLHLATRDLVKMGYTDADDQVVPMYFTEHPDQLPAKLWRVIRLVSTAFWFKWAYEASQRLKAPLQIKWNSTTVEQAEAGSYALTTLVINAELEDTWWKYTDVIKMNVNFIPVGAVGVPFVLMNASSDWNCNWGADAIRIPLVTFQIRWRIPPLPAQR